MIYNIIVTGEARQFLKRVKVYIIMKNLNIIKFVLIFCIVMTSVFASAHYVDYKEKFTETKYFERDNVVVSKTIWIDYDNDDRYSTYDYRHGYSYRTSGDYFEKRYSRDCYDRHYDYGSTRNSVPSKLGIDIPFSSGKRTRYEYVPHMRNYEKRDCYVNAPADKLFYIKC